MRPVPKIVVERTSSIRPTSLFTLDITSPVRLRVKKPTRMPEQPVKELPAKVSHDPLTDRRRQIRRTTQLFASAGQPCPPPSKRPH